MPQNMSSDKALTSLREDFLKGLIKSKANTGIAPIDVAAHLNLLGEALIDTSRVIAAHEGPLSEPGVYSVLLDTLLCAVGPLLCLASEIEGIDVSSDVLKNILDHIAYFLPGLP